MSRAGSRVPRYRPGYGRIGDNKVAWLVTVVTKTVSLLSVDAAKLEQEEELPINLTSEAGESKIIVIDVPGRVRPLYWNLSGMTMDELNATRAFFQMAFDEAEPVVRMRDGVAADAYAEGDDSYQRVYRAVPQFIVRERKEPGNGQSVQQRPEGVHEGSQPDDGVAG